MIALKQNILAENVYFQFKLTPTLLLANIYVGNLGSGD